MPLPPGTYPISGAVVLTGEKPTPTLALYEAGARWLGSGGAEWIEQRGQSGNFTYHWVDPAVALSTETDNRRTGDTWTNASAHSSDGLAAVLTAHGRTQDHASVVHITGNFITAVRSYRAGQFYYLAPHHLTEALMTLMGDHPVDAPSFNNYLASEDAEPFRVYTSPELVPGIAANAELDGDYLLVIRDVDVIIPSNARSTSATNGVRIYVADNDGAGNQVHSATFAYAPGSAVIAFNISPSEEGNTVLQDNLATTPGEVNFAVGFFGDNVPRGDLAYHRMRVDRHLRPGGDAHDEMAREAAAMALVEVAGKQDTLSSQDWASLASIEIDPATVNVDDFQRTFTLRYAQAAIQRVATQVWAEVNISGFTLPRVRLDQTQSADFTLTSDQADTVAVNVATEPTAAIFIRLYDAESAGNQAAVIRLHLVVVHNPPSEVQTLASAAAVAWAVGSGEIANLTLGHNVTLSMSGGADGDIALLRATQDGTGSRTLTLGSSITRNGPDAPVLSTAAAETDLLMFHRIGSGWHYVGIIKDV